ncbi:SAM hydroxide adenosyltransferase [Haloferula sp. BvORR071]|uniref:SAM hydroxide adenosyltransferase n=1 Tax=Haloferula sp. BvORR071 TaxID=1396141 RepID=UPI0005575E4B|nr:SAM hydroxide adenosyltransferase [Haloferula sp. BvORR071]
MRLLAGILFSLLLLPLHAAVSRGEIGGAKFMIATPEKWQGKLILIAHGYYPEGDKLEADFDETRGFRKELIDQGWGIAQTSYRRNGWIIEDAIADLKALREQVVKEQGKVERCLLIGSSMGGLIGTLSAEGAMNGVDGAVLIGAYLGDSGREQNAFYKTLNYKPRIPILYLTNETELDYPRRYRQQAGPDKTALWEIKRPGHCNVSERERLAGVLALNDWIEGKEMVRERDGTVLPPTRESTARKEGESLVAKVTAVSEGFGNLSTNFVAADLQALGLKPGDKARARCGEKTLDLLVTRYWSEAPEGKGCIYVTPEGWLGIVINGGRAEGALGAKKESEILLEKIP